MKKLVLFGLLNSLIIISCKTTMDVSYLPPAGPGDILTTLNGYTQQDALDQIAYSDTTVERRPINTQFWFSKGIICNIKKLLDDESKGPIKPDGIRIYFSRIKKPVGTLLQDNNGIMIVSTYHLADVVTNGVTEHIHQDYFNHAENADLFNMKDQNQNPIDIHGKPSHDNDATNGALLLSRSQLNPCTLITEHDIPRNMAEEMVWRFPKRSILRPGKMNARAEWFDIKMIDNVVNVLNSPGEDGIRIYFSRGTTKYKLESVKYKKDYTKNKVKFILVTTEAVPASSSSNFIHRDDLDCDKLKMIPFVDNAKDNGELCPTHCQGTTTPPTQ